MDKDGHPSAAPVLRFDLTAAITDVKQLRAGWRAFGALFAMIGAGMAIVGSLLLVTHYDPPSAMYEESGAILAVMGAIVALASWPLATQTRNYPTSLTVSERELTVGSDSRGLSRAYLWSDSDLRMGLIDRRGLPAVRPDGRPRHPFALQVGGKGPWIPVPEKAFDAILAQSKSHGLKVSRRTETAPGTPGTFEEISIRGPQ
jgi:hypothetical protein